MPVHGVLINSASITLLHTMSHLREPPEAPRHSRVTSIRHAGVLGAVLLPPPYLFATRRTDSCALYSISPCFVAFTVYSCVPLSAVAPSVGILSLGLSWISFSGWYTVWSLSSIPCAVFLIDPTVIPNLTRSLTGSAFVLMCIHTFSCRWLMSSNTAP